MTRIPTAYLGVAAAILAATAWAPAASAQQEIGDVELVRVWATGTPPASGKRDLIVEDAVFSNEFVETVRDGALHLRFRDDTEFRLGSNSKAVLDNFVYDPDTDSGEIAISLSKGLFRYVSGKLKGDKITIKTPTATVGLRGTVVTIYVGPDGETIVDVDEGEATLRALTSNVMRAVTAGALMAKADRDGNVTGFDGALPEDAGLDAKSAHEGRGGLRTRNSGRGPGSRVAFGSASNAQDVDALSPTSVLDGLSRQALGTEVARIVVEAAPGSTLVNPPQPSVSKEVTEARTDRQNADEATSSRGGNGDNGDNGPTDPIDLPPVEVGVFDVDSPSQDGVVYEDVFGAGIISDGPGQGDVVDYELIGDFPNQDAFADDIGLGGTSGTIELVPGVTDSGDISIPLDSIVLAFGAPDEFTMSITGAVDGGPSGIPGFVVFLNSAGAPIFEDFEINAGQTAFVAVTTISEQGVASVGSVSQVKDLAELTRRTKNRSRRDR